MSKSSRLRFRLFVTWNIHTVAFSPHFCFLVIFALLMLMLSILFLVAVINLFPHFYCILRVDSSTISWMLVTALPPSFLGTYSLFTSSLGCKALCIVVSFLVLWSICWSFYLVHFKNGPLYLKKETTLWWNFCSIVCFRVVFLFFWDTHFWWFFFILMVSTSNIPKYL